jgi:hypothetical protein
MDGGFHDYVLLVAGCWLTLQLAGLALLRGGWRIAAWICAGIMGAALAVAILGVLGGSNLAPIWGVFALPVCLAWMVVLWLVRGLWWLVRSAAA